MSTLRLTKDHAKYGKKGTVATVPFVEANALVAAGHAERPGDVPDSGRSGLVVARADVIVPKADHDAALKRIKEQDVEIAELKELLAAADAKGKDTKPPAK